MKKNDIFTFTTPNGVEVTAVVLHQTNYTKCSEHYSYNEYLCYSQNRLFIVESYTDDDTSKELDLT